MSSYEYHEFRAVDRPLTPAEQREVASLSSRAEVSARHAAFTYNYSSFRGAPEKLLTKYYDAKLYIDNSGLRLIFRLPARHFNPDPAQGELEPDAKQQQHNSELGENLDLVEILDKSQRVGADHRSGDDEPRDGRHLQVAQKRDHGDGRRKDDDQVLEENQLSHRQYRSHICASIYQR
jgi:hypothetical protein